MTPTGTPGVCGVQWSQANSEQLLSASAPSATLMIHPDTEVRFIDHEVGYGVFAREFIPRGTVTWVRDQLDREFSPPELEAFTPATRETLDRYSYRNAKGHYVFCWDHARFMNHSAQPTCLLTPYGFEIAVRDIPADDELSNDYGCFNIIEPFSPKVEADGRATVQHDDLTRFSAQWDAQIAAAVNFLHHVNQPLLPLIAPTVWISSATLRAVTPDSVQLLSFSSTASDR